MNVYDLIINLLLMREFTANQNNNCSQISNGKTLYSILTSSHDFNLF